MRRILLFTTIYFISQQGFIMELQARFFVSKTNFCIYAYTEFPQWSTKKQSETSLRFLPGEDINIRFEVPPSIDLIDMNKYQSLIQEKEEHGTNKQGIIYKKVFVKSFERFGYSFTKNQKKALVLTLESQPEQGLANLDEMIKNSFDFLDPNDLSESQINIILYESIYRNEILEMQSRNKTPLTFKATKQKDKYVVSLKNHRGGPVYHILKSDLTVSKIKKP